MKTQYTPGPWLTPGTDDDAYIISHIDAKGKQRTLAHVYSADNAQLIAAAPDLLAALQECITEPGATCFVRHKEHPEYMDRRLNYITETARAAIDKATRDQQ